MFGKDLGLLNLLVLSPHRDDAAFSLSLSLARWLGEGHEVTLLNVFTRSLYAPCADLRHVPQRERLDYVSRLRRDEDCEFVQTLGGSFRMLDLDLDDAPMRLGCDASTVCDMDIDPDDPATPHIEQALRQWLNAQEIPGKCGLILPLALGHHVDHRVARDAALPFSTRFPCAFYEDLPYAMRPGVRTDLSRFRDDTKTRLHEPLFPALCHGTHTRPAEQKRRIASIYKSQIDAQQAAAIANFAHRYHGAERLWVNRPWLDIAVTNRLSTRQQDMEKEPLPA
jgi:LmbE family N-acetylglucosaminyl deacetylase